MEQLGFERRAHILDKLAHILCSIYSLLFYIIHSCYVVSFHYSSISEIIKYYLMHRNISTAKLNISINTPLVIEQREI